MLGDRLLTRGLDYEIDYDVGQVTLLEPEQLFVATPDASIRATWEQRSLFQVSPSQVFGLRIVDLNILRAQWSQFFNLLLRLKFEFFAGSDFFSWCTWPCCLPERGWLRGYQGG